MARYIAFLRAINVGGHNVKMEQLRALFEGLGFNSVATFIASGNVIFETDSTGGLELEERIESHLKAALGYEVATFLRTPAEVAKVAQCETVPAAARAAATALNVAFLKAPLASEGAVRLQSLRTEIDSFYLDGRELYWLCARKQSDSAFSNAVFEKALRIRATFRGLGTVAKLAAKYPG
ncbi:MAG TPA: DUF1697 domain-containing protein [Thermoanaerobaculia bacterium]|nr:DUF1697 domain-containing protein [Thermoanaerobaculia bacterium]